jgi:hypothetical protein
MIAERKNFTGLNKHLSSPLFISLVESIKSFRFRQNNLRRLYKSKQ